MLVCLSNAQIKQDISELKINYSLFILCCYRIRGLSVQGVLIVLFKFFFY